MHILKLLIQLTCVPISSKSFCFTLCTQLAISYSEVDLFECSHFVKSVHVCFPPTWQKGNSIWRNMLHKWLLCIDNILGKLINKLALISIVLRKWNCCYQSNRKTVPIRIAHDHRSKHNNAGCHTICEVSKNIVMHNSRTWLVHFRKLAHLLSRVETQNRQTSKC